MELSRLSAKNKRIQLWREFVTSGQVRDEVLRGRIVQKLSDFSSLLTNCWEEGAVSQQAEAAIYDLERELEDLNEQARMNFGAQADRY